jgi:hypothetical protein
VTSPAPDPSTTSAAWVALAAVVVLVAAVGALVLRGDVEELTASPDTATTPTAEATPERSEPSPAVDTAALDEQIRAIAATVEQMREMEFERLPEPTFMSEDEIADRVDELLAEYTEEEADLDRRLLVALGAMEPDDDLRELYRDALSEQVAGLYDPETEELVVVATPEGEPLGPLGQITLVHELGHALLDQVIGLPDGGDEVEEGDEDRALAAQAVVEGDATLLMLLYAQRELTTEEQFELLEEQQDAATELGAIDDLPHFVRRQLMFPYEEGLAFVAEVQQREGWERINAGFEDPPASTLDVLEPDRFLAGPTTVAEVPEPPEPGGGWEHATARGIGAAHLMFLFEAPGGDDSRALEGPRGVAGLWRGGTVDVWTDDEETAVAMNLLGEDGLCGAVATWYERAFPGADAADRAGGTTYTGDRQDAHLTCTGDEVRLGIAPDAETAVALAG